MSDPIDDIKRYAPASLKVTLRDGTEKAVAVPKAGNRWARTSQILGSLPWVQIECLDKDGRTVGVIEDDEDADGLGDDEDDSERGSRDIAIARVLLEVQRSTMKETRLMFDAQLRGQGELLGAMTTGMSDLMGMYRQSMAFQAANLTANAAAPANEGGGGDEVMRMMQMAMMMMNQPKIEPKKEG